jgi:hypothetical protein
MTKRTLKLKRTEAGRRKSMAVAALVVAAGLFPGAYAREASQPKPSPVNAARKAAEAFVEAHAKNDHAAALGCLSRASLMKHKAILTKERFRGSIPLTSLLSVVKANRLKEDVVVRLRPDPKKARSAAQKRLAKTFANEVITLCLVREGKAWKVDLDKSKAMSNKKAKGADQGKR